jgi:hypothetical protein
VSGKGVKHEIIINALRPWRAVAGLEINGIDQPKVRALQRVAGLSVVPAWRLIYQASTFFLIGISVTA